MLIIANQQLESLRAQAAREALLINETKIEVMTFSIDQASSNSGGSVVYLSDDTKVDTFAIGVDDEVKDLRFCDKYRLAGSAFGSMERIWKAEH